MRSRIVWRRPEDGGSRQGLITVRGRRPKCATDCSSAGNLTPSLRTGSNAGGRAWANTSSLYLLWSPTEPTSQFDAYRHASLNIACLPSLATIPCAPRLSRSLSPLYNRTYHRHRDPTSPSYPCPYPLRGCPSLVWNPQPLRQARIDSTERSSGSFLSRSAITTMSPPMFHDIWFKSLGAANIVECLVW